MYFLSSDVLKKIVGGSYEANIMMVQEALQRQYPDHNLMATFASHAILMKEDDKGIDVLRVEYKRNKGGIDLLESQKLDFSKDVISSDDVLDVVSTRVVDQLMDETIDSNKRQRSIRDAFFDILERCGDDLDMDEYLREVSRMESCDMPWCNWLHERADDIERMLFEDDGYYRTSFVHEEYNDKSAKILLEFLKKFAKVLNMCLMEGNDFVNKDKDFIWEDIEQFSIDACNSVKRAIWLIERLDKVKDDVVQERAFSAVLSKYSDMDVACRVMQNIFKSKRS